MTLHPTYETFVIHTIMPAPGWQAVYWFDDHHEAMPIHTLALVSRQTRLSPTGELLGQETDDERDIVGLDYTPRDGWSVCDDDGAYCGLLPPGLTLVDFEAQHRHALMTQEERA